MKISQSADCIHSTIPQSFLEKRVIATTLFNRLHNILQNSTLYLVYPCNRTSRFSHSIGCMHIAGEVFRNGIANAKGPALNRFLEQMINAISVVEKANNFRAVREGAPKDLKWNTLEGLTDHLYSTSTPTLSVAAEGMDAGKANMSGEGEFSFRYLYTVALQAIRLVGLLHDLGHPPFSHVTEHAVLDLAKIVARSRPKDSRLAKEVTNFVSTMEKMSDQGLHKLKPHEDLGRNLIAGLLQEVCDGLTKDLPEEYSGNPKDYRFARFALLVRGFVLSILDNEDTFFEALHEIVDGNLDADRLDYVVRDLFSSGIYRDTIQYSRLFSSYTLHYEEGSDAPLFLPSTRALSTVEDFFWQRLFLYRYVVFHHRVAKMDGLLKEALITLGTLYFEGKAPVSQPAPAQVGDALPPHITSLWSVFSLPQENYRQYLANYSQWDDALLLGILRQVFFSNDFSNIPFPLSLQLTELLSNKPRYISLVKRLDDFLEIDDSFRGAFLDSVKATPPARLTDKMTRLKPDYRKDMTASLRELARFARKCKNEKRGRRKLLQSEGLFTRKFNKALELAAIPHTTLFKAASKEVEQELEGSADSGTLRVHVFVVAKDPTTGVKDQKLLAGDEAVLLEDISPIVRELERTISVFPSFFVYVALPKGNVSNPAAIRTSLGRALFNQFCRLTGIPK